MGFESMPKGEISHEEAVAAHERFIESVRKAIKEREDAVASYKQKLAEYKAEKEAVGREGSSVHAGSSEAIKLANAEEGIRAMENLIKEAEAEKARQEARLTE